VSYGAWEAERVKLLGTSLLEGVLVGARFFVRLPAFLREPVSLDEARAVLRRRLEQREADFLALVRRAIYDNPANPYRELLNLAGCEYGDLERLVNHEGVDGALHALLLNVSLGDQARVVRRRCGCVLEALGWTTHLETIRSFEKLTAGGIAFLDTDVVRVLEELLPVRFGGGPTDYQLVEEEIENGRPCLRLLIHPAVGPLNPDEVAEAFLHAVSPGSGIERLAGLLWQGGHFLRIERRPPLTMASGKVLHLHVPRSQG
jgi:hypothetical protein